MDENGQFKSTNEEPTTHGDSPWQTLKLPERYSALHGDIGPPWSLKPVKIPNFVE